ncbi:uncharacterized protein (TIGR00369 family) [Caulobacter ginsengisoli]|uniref:Uncharacterized protein (TIGR00369 family) n=1 Tax=Caulobacter ginsengisoli TaxID=400775 RepID=A0ABU0IPA3_9CAUL|nr:PaaI family thioesterase [Caulobacter ginsengisoli]MDQ0463840.1 uncharacterized protein (TIGR00369 family) [Caulobacter ginsengisoli]
MDPPEGYQPHFRKSRVTDPWEPIYSRRTDDAVWIGFWAGEAHANSRGFVHGGVIAALADNAMGLSCGQGLDAPSGLVTVNLAIDYLGTARVGQWVAIEVTVVKRGRSLCFAQALITADGVACARANATFQVLK